MKIAVLGAGAWGTALAAAAAPRHEVLLWARDAAQSAEMAASTRNARYLGDVPLPPSLKFSSSHGEALSHAASGLLVIATPMSGLRAQLQAVPADRPVLWLCKGFEAGSGALAHEIARDLRPEGSCGVLSGPSFALEVALGQATALVAASESEALRQTAVEAFHSEQLRIYTADDLIGVEVGGAVKNVMAIATGILDGVGARSADGGLGLNARAALITRGLAEMTRLGVALGARAETFMGLSGLGDLVLTATGDLSRNRKVGLMLAAGQPLASILADLGHVAEGVYSAATVRDRARALRVEMPITEAVVDVLEGRTDVATAIQQLMSRQPRAELQAPPA